MTEHNDLIKAQFSKQASTFGSMTGHYEALDLITQMTQADKKDTVLDVACGPGIVACAFAKKVTTVKGIDLVPAMIERARKAQMDAGLTNMSWDVGTVDPLPYPHCSYSIVVSRFSFHHFLEPLAVLKEMARVVQWEGHVAVIDVFVTNQEQSEIYDQMEKLRDPSHTRALFLDELVRMFEEAELNIIDQKFYRLHVDVDELLKASFTPGPDAQTVRDIIRADIGLNRLGIDARIEDRRLKFSFPVTIIIGQKEAPANYGLSCCS